MDRVFLDANVLFSMAYGGATMCLLSEIDVQGKAVLLTSAYAWEEARRNLTGHDQLDRLGAIASLVTVLPEVPEGVSCPLSLPGKDRPVLVAAMQAGATHFLTGDRRHFGDHYGRSAGGVLICSPRFYLTPHISA